MRLNLRRISGGPGQDFPDPGHDVLRAGQGDGVPQGLLALGGADGVDGRKHPAVQRGYQFLPGGLPAGMGNGYHGTAGKRRRGGMTKTELIAELTDICIRQAEIIKAQAYILEQFGAQVREEEALAAQNRLREMGCWED